MALRTCDLRIGVDCGEPVPPLAMAAHHGIVLAIRLSSAATDTPSEISGYRSEDVVRRVETQTPPFSPHSPASASSKQLIIKHSHHVHDSFRLSQHDARRSIQRPDGSFVLRTCTQPLHLHSHGENGFNLQLNKWVSCFLAPCAVSSLFHAHPCDSATNL